MTTVSESVVSKTPMGADLAAGLDTLSLNQTITFTRYVRLVLPIDGFVFWVRADLVTGGALYNADRFNTVRFGQSPKMATPAETLVAKGSMHYATDTRQEEAENYAANRMVFTSEQEVIELNAIAEHETWIGEFDGRRFGFSSRSSWYRQSNLFHYVGFAVYPDMETQIIDSLAGFDSREVIVSNSLPAWLGLNGYASPYSLFSNPSLILYPAFLPPQNIAPPLATVRVMTDTTRALSMAPHIGKRTASHSQLCAERVRITLWGTRNFTAMDFVDCVNDYSLNTELFGMMAPAAMRDDPTRTQSELGIIAQKKVIEYDISYQQRRMRTLSMQKIKSAIINFAIDGVPFPPPPAIPAAIDFLPFIPGLG